MTTHPHLQFRFWCPAANSHIHDYRYSGPVDELFQNDSVLVTEQCTGLRDRDGHFVYEGDLVEVCVSRGMPAWEGGRAVGDAFLDRMGGETLKLEVMRDPVCPCNLYLSGRVGAGPEIFLPVSWVTRGTVVGRGGS